HLDDRQGFRAQAAAIARAGPRRAGTAGRLEFSQWARADLRRHVRLHGLSRLLGHPPAVRPLAVVAWTVGHGRVRRAEPDLPGSPLADRRRRLVPARDCLPDRPDGALPASQRAPTLSSVPVIWNAHAGQKVRGPRAPTGPDELLGVLSEAG